MVILRVRFNKARRYQSILRSLTLIMSRKSLPETTAYVKITQLSWQQGFIIGEVNAGDFVWEFHWLFKQDNLLVKPSIGRALIQEPLGRFLEKCDYQLEPGGDYAFTIRAQL